MKETSQNEIYYTTEWWDHNNDLVSDYYGDEDNDPVQLPGTYWLIQESPEEAKKRIKEEEEVHSNVKHRAVILVKSEWLNDELNEI